jgi:hypothetical protein
LFCPMAFRTRAAPAFCCVCSREERFFRMMMSFREQHRWETSGGDVRGSTVCIECEQNLRKEEWDSWSDEKRRAMGENYFVLENIRREQKNLAKASWATRTEPILNARTTIKALKRVAEQQVIRVNFAKVNDVVTEWELVSSVGHTHSHNSYADFGDGVAAEHSGQLHPPKTSSMDVVEMPMDGNRLTSREIRQYAIRKSKDLVRGIMGFMKGDSDLLETFASAGRKLVSEMTLYENLQSCRERWEKSNVQKDFDALEDAELKFEESSRYETAMWLPEEEQIKTLKALDYCDEICRGWRKYYVCKAGGEGAACGLAYPSKLWHQKGRVSHAVKEERFMPGNWQYRCQVCWEYLHEEAIDNRKSAAASWFRELKEKFGDITKFPQIGCGSNYKPFKNGASMVCEIQLRKSGDPNAWEAFLAEQMPTALDDRIKSLTYTSLSKSFATLTPDTIIRSIPITMPMTNLMTVDGYELKGVAKYPIDAWKLAGNPVFTQEAWAKLCLLIAENGQRLNCLDDSEKLAYDELFTTSSRLLVPK